MAFRLAELAELVQGELTGDGSIVISGAAPLRDVQPGQISLVDRPENTRLLAGLSPAALMVPASVRPEGVPYITVRDVHAAFAAIVARFRPAPVAVRPGISPAAVVSESAKIAPTATVHPLAVIEEGVEIGPGCVIHSGARIASGCVLAENVTIFPNAVLYEGTRVGPRSIVHAGAVLGAFGFGYSTVSGRHVLGSQLGHVELEADVEIGAGTTIDRGTYGATRIGEGTKIDNQVQIGHNCHIGRHNLICSQVGVAGSCTTGDYVVMAGQSGVADHVEVGDRAILGAKAGVHHAVPSGTTVLGAPALPISEQRRMMAAYTKLPEMRSQLKAIQRTLDEHFPAAARPADERSDAA